MIIWAKVARFFFFTGVGIFAFGGLLTYATGSGVFDPDRPVEVADIEEPVVPDAPVEIVAALPEKAKVTRCPGDGGSMLYKMLTPIGEDCAKSEPKVEPVAVELTQDALRGVASYRCKAIIETALNDPGSVQWDDDTRWRVTDDAENTWTVYPTLRAKNAFGALVRGAFRCQVSRDGPDNWSLLSLEQIQ